MDESTNVTNDNLSVDSEQVITESIDLSKVEEKLEELIKVQTPTEEEIKKAEQEQKKAEEELKKEEQTKAEEKVLLEKKETQEQEYKTQLLEFTQDTSNTNEELLAEIKTLNSTIQEMREIDFRNMNEMSVVSSMTVAICIIVVMSIKVLVDQITKW